MGGQRPTLSTSDVRRILRNARFEKKRTKGSHETWEGYVRAKRRVVTLDDNCAPFTPRNPMTKSMINQSGLTPDEFYGLLDGAAAVDAALFARATPEPDAAGD